MSLLPQFDNKHIPLIFKEHMRNNFEILNPTDRELEKLEECSKRRFKDNCEKRRPRNRKKQDIRIGSGNCQKEETNKQTNKKQVRKKIQKGSPISHGRLVVGPGGSITIPPGIFLDPFVAFNTISYSVFLYMSLFSLRVGVGGIVLWWICSFLN